MATAIGSLFVDLSVNSAAFSADLGRAQAALTSRAARMNRTLGGLTRHFNLTAASAAGLAVGVGVVAVGALTAATKRAIETANAVKQSADKIGIGTDAYQELGYAAGQADVQQRVFEMGLQRFSRRVGEAVNNQGELLGTLKQYNIQLTDAQGRTRALEDIFDDYAEAVRNADSAQEQLRLAFKGFDSEGAVMVNLMRRGKEGIADLREEARRVGAVIDSSLVRNAESARDELTRLDRIMATSSTTALLHLAPALETVAGWMVSAAEAAGNFFAWFAGPESDSIIAVTKKLEMLKDMRADIIADLPAGQTTSKRLERINQDIEAMTARLKELQELRNSFKPLFGGGDRPALTPATDVVDKLMTQLDRQIMQVETLNAAYGKTEGTLARYNAAMQISAALSDANIEYTDELAAAFKIYLDDLERATDESVELRRAEEMRLEQQRRLEERNAQARLEAERRLEAQRRQTEHYARSAASAITSGMENMIMRTTSASEAMKQLAADLLLVILRASILGPAEKALTSFFSGLGSGASTSSGGGFQQPKPIAAASGVDFIVGGAGGTDANRLALDVTKGERVTVRTEAQQRAANQAGGGIVIGSIDLRGASVESVKRLEMLLAQLNASIEGRVVNTMLETRRRGGVAGRA